jgi:segregation and condensation protein B
MADDAIPQFEDTTTPPDAPPQPTDPAMEAADDEPVAPDQAAAEDESAEGEDAAQGGADDEDLRSVIEALVFASDEPITFRQLKDVIVGPDGDEGDANGDGDGEDGGASGPREPEEAQPVRQGRRRNAARFTLNLVKRCVDALNTEYRSTGRSFRITEVAGGFAFQTVHDYGIYVGRLHADKARRRLSQSALETLAIIAFKQPISKPSIEAIRGVNADFVLKSLLERNLVTIVGRDSTVGRPLLYGTTKTFLKHFGLKNLDDLPRPREIQELLEEDAAMAALSVDDVEQRKHAELHHLSPEDEHIFDTLAGGAEENDENAGENEDAIDPSDPIYQSNDDDEGGTDHATENPDDPQNR